MNTENLSTLKIHKLTQAQYERELAAGKIDPNALYLTPDEEVDLSGYATKSEVSSAISAISHPIKSVNGKTGAVSLTASDVSAVPTSRTVNGRALSSNITLSASDVSAVPTSRTVNGKALSSNITLSASDVNAATLGSNTFTASQTIPNNSRFKSKDTSGVEVNLIGVSDNNNLVIGGSANPKPVYVFGELQLDTDLGVSYGGTGATTAVEALQNLGAPNINHITDNAHLIGSGDDLNNYTTPDVYRCSTATIAASLSNAPKYTSSGFRLIVSALSGADTGIYQVAVFNAGQVRFYFRHRTSGGTWTPWNRVLTSILTTEEYGTSFPTTNLEKGQLFFKKA